MKKKLFAYLLALAGMATFSACTEEAGTEPGGDSQPSVVLYQYTISAGEGDYNPDNDTHLRVAVNNQVSDIYYLAEPTETHDAYIESNGEDAYRQHVVDNGTQATVTDGVADIYVTGLFGAYTITVVGTGLNNALCSANVTFFGYTWNTLATGGVVAALLDGTTEYTLMPGFTLQQRDDNPNFYRIPNLYGNGYHLVIQAQGEPETEAGDFFQQEGVSYQTVTLQTLGTPYSYGDYGQISLSDYATYSGNQDYLYYNRLYANNYLYVQSIYTVSAGYIVQGYVQFIPD
ncbi:MAG TPA: hypothetical protein H9814_03195 [Candidatus Bacteroides merdigallinarum]|uniref:Lipoprotein n=1 Tax=Candidatus Bacteroides merdigallinarum TaxID=2838473 RepID=A0A9D2J0Y2_9BACE|nr:hypothetical protein [Candidatus Bacteroides merdigallinarum]